MQDYILDIKHQLICVKSLHDNCGCFKCKEQSGGSESLVENYQKNKVITKKILPTMGRILKQQNSTFLKMLVFLTMNAMKPLPIYQKKYLKIIFGKLKSVKRKKPLEDKQTVIELMRALKVQNG